MRSVVSHVRRHVIGYTALFLVLAGTSYAAIRLPANSVGTRQIRNGAVTLSKISQDAQNALKGQQGPPGQPGSGGVGACGFSDNPQAGSSPVNHCGSATGNSFQIQTFCDPGGVPVVRLQTISSTASVDAESVIGATNTTGAIAAQTGANLAAGGGTATEDLIRTPANNRAVGTATVTSGGKTWLVTSSGVGLGSFCVLRGAVIPTTAG